MSKPLKANSFQHRAMSWLICLVPTFVCVWLFDNVNCGVWAPYVFGRVIGVDGVPVDENGQPR